MNGKMAAFFSSSRNLLLCCDICFCLFWFSVVTHFLDYFADSFIDFMIAELFFQRVCEEDVIAGESVKVMLLSAPAFADSSLEKVSLDCPLEHLFRDRNQNAVLLRFGISTETVTQSGDFTVPAFGKKR